MEKGGFGKSVNRVKGGDIKVRRINYFLSLSPSSLSLFLFFLSFFSFFNSSTCPLSHFAQLTSLSPSLFGIQSYFNFRVWLLLRNYITGQFCHDSRSIIMRCRDKNWGSSLQCCIIKNVLCHYIFQKYFSLATLK